jgi:hypothetical protein
MAVLSMNTTVETLNYTYANAADQLAYTDAVAWEAAAVTQAVLGLDLHAISLKLAQSIVGALR